MPDDVCLYCDSEIRPAEAFVAIKRVPAVADMVNGEEVIGFVHDDGCVEEVRSNGWE